MIFLLSTTRSNLMIFYFALCFVHIVEFMFSGFEYFEHCICNYYVFSPFLVIREPFFHGNTHSGINNNKILPEGCKKF